MHAELVRPLDGRVIHFVGIGGAGMAALAELALALGYGVSGSDLKDSRPVRRLVERGARVHVGPHLEEAIDDADHVIVSAAVPDGNPEVEAARARGVEVLSRAELLGRFFDANRGVAVAGTHGKTTTSSMVARALDAAGATPSFIIGGDLNDVGSGARLGSDLLVAEADEAYGSFLHLRSSLAVVTNVDVDHLDHYADRDEIDAAFLTFLGQRVGDAPAVVCADDPGVRRLMDRIAAPIVLYGTTEDAEMHLTQGPDGWRLRWRGADLGRLRLQVPGRHNVLNAAGAVCAGLLLGVEPGPLLEGLAGFGGVERRFTRRGQAGGVHVVDDYAHHPREIAATISAAREAYPEARVVVLFQPHLYSRTQQLADDFGVAFDGAGAVVVTNIYGAREDPIPGVTGRLIVDAVRERGATDTIPTYVPLLDEAAGFVAGLARPGDVIVTMGAGDVTGVAPTILELLAEVAAGDVG